MQLKYLHSERQNLGNKEKRGPFPVQSLAYDMVGSTKTWWVIGTIAAQTQAAQEGEARKKKRTPLLPELPSMCRGPWPRMRM